MQDSYKTHTISTSLGPLCYGQYGSGPKSLLVFHGFGQDHSIALPLASSIQEQYTVYSFDLPYHGNSKWSASQQLVTKEIITKIFEKWLYDCQITEFSVFGYSMGGKFAISLAESFPEKVKNLILVAPDGIFKSHWYRLATSWPIKFLFHQIIDRPGAFFLITKVIRMTRLVPEKLVQFGESQMAKKELRSMVYYTWINFQQLFIDRKVLKKSISTGDLQATLILGKLDRLINPKKLIPIINGVGFDVNLLEAGHAKVLELTPTLLKTILK
jgi:pimeloyl-ACP methyl ester carboxylesterase